MTYNLKNECLQYPLYSQGKMQFSTVNIFMPTKLLLM